MTAKELVYRSLGLGRSQAKSQHILSAITGLSRRTVREAITSLILDSDALIGSSTEPTGGYYIISNHEELRAAIAHLYPREVEIRKRRLKLQQNGGMVFSAGEGADGG